MTVLPTKRLPGNVSALTGLLCAAVFIGRPEVRFRNGAAHLVADHPAMAYCRRTAGYDVAPVYGDPTEYAALVTASTG